MAWTESGLFYPTIRDQLDAALATNVNWTATTNKLALSNNSYTPDFFGTTDPSTWTNSNEVTGTGWSTGGVAVSAAASGGSSMSPAMSHVGPGPTLLKFTFWNNLSVAGTTLTNVFGCEIYSTAATNTPMFVGIWFGGTAYNTVAGTFAITWNASGVITIQLAS